MAKKKITGSVWGVFIPVVLDKQIRGEQRRREKIAGVAIPRSAIMRELIREGLAHH